MQESALTRIQLTVTKDTDREGSLRRLGPSYYDADNDIHIVR